jgi:DNA-binding YbaB/EbfC family protein
MNINNLMQQAQKMQKEYSKKINEFNNKEFEYNYQNGCVIIKMTGALKIIKLTINKSLIDPDDVITLEEMVSEAINNAIALITDKKNDLAPSNGLF